MIRIIGLLGTNRTALMDDADYQALPGYRYYYDPTAAGYVCAVPPGGQLKDGNRLHVVLMGKQARGRVVDHIDGNGMNNTRANLRVVRPHTNQMNRHRLNKNNTSGVRGVYAFNLTPGKPWRASIMVERKTINLGCFATKDEAVAARHHGELKYFGELCPTSKAS